MQRSQYYLAGLVLAFSIVVLISSIGRLSTDRECVPQSHTAWSEDYEDAWVGCGYCTSEPTSESQVRTVNHDYGVVSILEPKENDYLTHNTTINITALVCNFGYITHSQITVVFNVTSPMNTSYFYEFCEIVEGLSQGQIAKVTFNWTIPLLGTLQTHLTYKLKIKTVLATNNDQNPANDAMTINITASRTYFQVAQMGIDWLQDYTIRWPSTAGYVGANSSYCYGCHVQTWAITGLSRAYTLGFNVNLTRLYRLVYEMKGIQRPDGRWAHASGLTYPYSWNDYYPITSTQFAAYSLAVFDTIMGHGNLDVRMNIINASNWLITHNTTGTQPGTIYWVIDHYEPPVDQSNYMLTANAIFTIARARDIAIELWGENDWHVAYYINAVEMAKKWLKLNLPVTPAFNQDRTYRIMGMIWGGANVTDPEVVDAVNDLLAHQQPDGGWKEYDAVYTDGSGSRDIKYSNSYATGQAITALKLIGNASHVGAIMNGTKYIIRSQILPTGYWTQGNSSQTVTHRPSQFAATMWPVLSLGDYSVFNFTLEYLDEIGTPMVHVEPGQTITLRMNVTNTGFGWSSHSAYFEDVIKLRLGGVPEYWVGYLSGAKLYHDPTDYPYEYRVRLRQDENAEFNLTLTAPLDGPPGFIAWVNVTAVSLNDLHVTRELSALAVLDIRYGVSISCLDPNRVINPGESTEFTLTAKNLGNVEDTLSFNLSETPPGWVVRLFTQYANLAVNESIDIVVNVTVPADALSGINIEFYVRVFSVKSIMYFPMPVQDSQRLIVVVSPKFNIQMSCPLWNKTLDPGTSVSYEIFVRNTGNSQGSVECKIASSTRDWTAVLDTTVFPLGPNETKSIMLTVWAPQDVAAHETLVVRVEGFDQTNPAITGFVETTSITTEYWGMYARATPDNKSADQGGVVTFDIEVFNTGNGDNTMHISLQSMQDVNWTVEFLIGDKTVSEILVPAKSSANFTAIVTIPREAPGGYYSILFNVSDDYGHGCGVPVSVKVNQIFKLAITAHPLEEISSPGEAVRYFINVSNLGNGEDTIVFSILRPDFFRTWFDLDSVTLAPGQYRELGVTIIPPVNCTAGQKDFRVTARSKGDVAVSVTFSMEVVLPDLEILNVEYRVGNKVTTTPNEQQVMTISVLIRNSGKAIANDVLVRMYVDERPAQEDITITSVPANTSNLKKFTWTALLGKHVIKFKVDPGMRILETKENNNEMSTTIEVLEEETGTFSTESMFICGLVIAILVLLMIILFYMAQKKRRELKLAEEQELAEQRAKQMDASMPGTAVEMDLNTPSDQGNFGNSGGNM